MQPNDAANARPIHARPWMYGGGPGRQVSDENEEADAQEVGDGGGVMVVGHGGGFWVGDAGGVGWWWWWWWWVMVVGDGDG